MKWKIRIETEGKTFLVIAHDLNTAASLLYFKRAIQGTGGITGKFLEQVAAETPNQYQLIS